MSASILEYSATPTLRIPGIGQLRGKREDYYLNVAHRQTDGRRRVGSDIGLLGWR